MKAPHPLRQNQADVLADLLGQVFGLDKQYPRERMLADLTSAAARRSCLVISEAGRPVSHIRTIYDHVSIFGCPVKVASIGGVATHPDSRGKGYATAILNQSLRQMLAARAKILIVSGRRGLYRRAHCVPAGRVFEADLRRQHLPNRPAHLTLRTIGFDHWPLLAPLHQAEPVRFLRTAEFLRHRPFWWDCYHPQLWLIESQASPLAYLAIARADPEWPQGPKAIVWEYAGSRAALLEALPALFQAAALPAIRLRILGHDREFLHLLAHQGIALKPSCLPGTHRLLDLPGLMRSLRPYLAARLPRPVLRQLAFDQREETCLFAYRAHRAELSLSEAAKLVLGAPVPPRLPRELASALSSIFPVPFPLPGFNYL